MCTYITLNLIHILRVLETHGIREVCVVMDWLFVVDIGGHILGHLCSCNANHVSGGMVAGFGVLIVLFVFTIGLHLCHIHVMDQLGIILEASETHVLSFCLLISFLVFILQRQNPVSKALATANIESNNSINAERFSELL